MSGLSLGFWIWAATLLTISGCALRFGGRSERLGAAAFLTAWVAGLVVARLPGLGYGVAVAILDIGLLAFLVGISLKTSRYWPLFAAGFHLLAVATHWAHQLDPALQNWTYQTAGIIWGYLPLWALAFGTWGAWRERRQTAKAAAPTGPGATLR